MKQAAIGGRRERIRLDGRRAQPDQPAVRLPVPHPLLDGPGHLRPGGAAAAADRTSGTRWPVTSPGEIGRHPARPVTARLLGVDDYGTPDAGAGPATELSTGPGFSNSWFDVETKTFRRA